MNRSLRPLALAAVLWLVPAAVLWLVPAAVSAQTVLVRVLSAETSTPVFGALTYLVDPAGETVRSGLTDERGRALFVGIPAGSYHVRAEMIGMATGETGLFDVAEGMSVSQDLRLSSTAIQLEGIEVEAEGGRCRVRPGGEGLAIANVWDEARKALAVASFTDQRGSYRYETMTYNRRMDRDFTILSEEESRREGYMLSPFESRPAEDLVENGFVQREDGDQVYYAPDADVLLSDAFLDTHCFRLARGSDDTAGLVGLGFEPTGENKRVADIAGTLWLDEETAELRWLDFSYRFLDPDITSDRIGGRVDFRRMPAGTWIVPEWWIRMPAVAERIDSQGRRTRFIDGYQLTGGLVLEVREAGGRRLGQRVETGGFEGTVVDSVGVPVRGARVGVVGSSQEVYTTPDGAYSITGLNPGRYQVRFVDPTLEEAGFVPPTVTRDVVRGEATALDYHMPSVGDVLFDACREVQRPEGSAVLAGIVRDARGRLVVGAAVQVRWAEYRVVGGVVTMPAETRGGTGFAGDGFSTTTDARGFYLFCGVPEDRTLSLVAELEDRSSEVHEVRIDLGDGAALQAVEMGRQRDD